MFIIAVNNASSFFASARFFLSAKDFRSYSSSVISRFFNWWSRAFCSASISRIFKAVIIEKTWVMDSAIALNCSNCFALFPFAFSNAESCSLIKASKCVDHASSAKSVAFFVSSLNLSTWSEMSGISYSSSVSISKASAKFVIATASLSSRVLAVILSSICQNALPPAVTVFSSSSKTRKSNLSCPRLPSFPANILIASASSRVFNSNSAKAERNASEPTAESFIVFLSFFMSSFSELIETIATSCISLACFIRSICSGV